MRPIGVSYKVRQIVVCECVFIVNCAGLRCVTFISACFSCRIAQIKNEKKLVMEQSQRKPLGLSLILWRFFPIKHDAKNCRLLQTVRVHSSSQLLEAEITRPHV